ncbi:MAG TPA: hypothetical protein VMG58_06220 [Candidatus Sulfotelmatobacter sp.]|nr:hypothetical protein [Candidatus Sulfotelmatobacter sp.]
MPEGWTDILTETLREAGQRLAIVAPRILAMLALIVLALVAASLARRLTVRLLRLARFDTGAARWGLGGALGRLGVREPPAVLAGQLVYWSLVLIGLLLGLEALEMPAANELIGLALWLLPNLLVAGIVLLAGWLLANFLSQAALIAAVNAQVAGAPLIAFAVRWLVLVFAGGAALTQLGIAREMVLLAFGIAFGGTVLALAMAFGLGAKELAREILESRLRKRDEDRDPVSHV